MGTNYYFITRNTRFAHKYFAEKIAENYYEGEYELEDCPYLRFAIHLNKCSCGWRPLFQVHKCFDTFDKLEKFYYEHQKYLKIIDEYEQEYTFEDYKEKIIRHATYRDPEPMKWVYGYEDFEIKYFPDTATKRLHLVDCSPEEADIWCPFNHLEYRQTQEEAAKKLNLWYSWMGHQDFYSHNDPDYPIDWSKGEFS